MDNKRNIWLASEVRVMLEIFGELNITKLIDGKKYKNHEIFKKVHEEMIKLGVATKSADQIKNKWKALKTSYNNTKKSNSMSGAQRTTCEFFDELNEILGARSAYSIDGIDSQRQDQEYHYNNESETENLEQVGKVQLEVDSNVTHEDLDALVAQVTGEGVKNDKTTKEIRETRKRKYGESSKSKEDLQFKYQREILKEFFANQNEIEERSAKQRMSDLKLVLNTFSKTMENIMKSQMPPMMPYSYMPFVSSSSSSQNMSSPKSEKKRSGSDTSSDSD